MHLSMTDGPPERRAKTLSVLIPVYNSAEILPELVSRLEPVLEQQASRFEAVLVDDDSRDGSWEAIERLASEKAWLRGVRLLRNFGQHNALLCALREATHEIVVTLDADLQHPPEEIPKLLAKLEEGYDVVYGTPEHEQHGLVRNLSSQITKLTLSGAMGAETARQVSAFRVFRMRLREAFGGFQGPFVNLDVLLTWASTSFAAIRVRHQPRLRGESTYTFRKLVIHALNMMTGFGTFPLQIASIMGFALTAFGALVFVYVVGRYLVFGSVVPGFPFLASIIAIFSGAQLFALGVIGEYLARIHFRMMGRPAYAIRTRASGGERS
jgi:undecaprenyl-phosphate 4-deoxy-4-formamido-L-arabinose transferase